MITWGMVVTVVLLVVVVVVVVVVVAVVVVVVVVVIVVVVAVVVGSGDQVVVDVAWGVEHNGQCEVDRVIVAVRRIVGHAACDVGGGTRVIDNHWDWNLIVCGHSPKYYSTAWKTMNQTNNQNKQTKQTNK